ncbi:MAG: serine/threonine-protein kinase [Bryobacteraceae bacterium]|nr:serine/threonine-protein kinase [Bryobacteraceae bacterium]
MNTGTDAPGPVLREGDRLGPYELGPLIGEGGMGSVFKARDVRLGRPVAVKVVKGPFTDRFDSEVRAIARLNHPHICAVYDVGTCRGRPYLVLEYLEDERLAGRISVRKALEYGSQIAAALEAAHRCGVVHRDLKPANVIVTAAGVKLLDFGIAKFITPTAAAYAETTEIISPTSACSVIGTPHYMAPEQLQGKQVDARTDIFALGCVLYEIISGCRAFAANSAVETTVAILTQYPPPLSTLVPDVPSAVERAVTRCMDKEPQRRWQSAREIHDELDRLHSSLADSPVPLRQGRFLFLAILFGLLILAFFAIRSQLEPAAAAVDPGQSFRFEVQPHAGWRFTTADATLGAPEFALSPSGRELAYVAASDNDGRHLWLQYLAEERATRLAGTERASLPFWSADGASIAFVVDNMLKAVSINGGSVRTIGEVGWDFRSGDWTSDRQILFCRSTGGLFRIPETGGDPTSLTHIGSANAQTLHRWPFVLPDRQHFLYLSRSSDAGSRGIFAGSLNDPASSKFVIPSRHSAVYANGYLLFLQESKIVAIQFDMALMSVSGRAAVVAENVHGSTNTVSFR